MSVTWALADKGCLTQHEEMWIGERVYYATETRRRPFRRCLVLLL